MKAFRRRFQISKLGSRGVLRDLVLILALVFLRFSWTWFGVGLAVFMVGCAFHFWSKGCLVRNWVVTTSGPYRLVRHPFYLANFLLDVGICIMSGNPCLLAGYVPLFLVAYIPVIQAGSGILLPPMRSTWPSLARCLASCPTEFTGSWDRWTYPGPIFNGSRKSPGSCGS